MSARKVAISLPEKLLEQVDEIAETRGETRSGFIATILAIASRARTSAMVQKQINDLFSDPEIRKEQLKTTRLMNRHRSTRGTEW